MANKPKRKKCAASGCVNKPMWVTGNISTHRVARYCIHCLPRVVLADDHLVLVQGQGQQ